MTSSVTASPVPETGNSTQEKRELEQELAKARFVVEVQAKLHALLA